MVAVALACGMINVGGVKLKVDIAAELGVKENSPSP